MCPTRALLVLATVLGIGPGSGLAADLPAGAGWRPWAPRAEIQPPCRIDADALTVSGGDNPREFGGWIRDVPGIHGGQHYRLSARFEATGVADPRRGVLARIDWLDAAGARVGQPDYAYRTEPAGAGMRVTAVAPAPAGAAQARVELLLAWAPTGTVRWSSVSLEACAAPPDRWVRLGTVSVHPRNDPDNLGAFLREVDRMAADKPDIVCLGEEIMNSGSHLTYAKAAQPIPGPATMRLGEAARRLHLYLVAGLIERDGPGLYNSTVLIDRQGRVAGKYRKVYLPREEVEGGLTPGNECPVFDTDFGRIGIMVCWDAEYIETARALATQGAEVILVPAAGGYLKLLMARALENHLFVVSSGGDVESAIIDPTGEPLFATLEAPRHAVVAVNLARRYDDPWLGDMRARFFKEMRPELYRPQSPAP